jgi:uncharacterized membrane protein
MQYIYPSILIILGFTGFLIASYIHRKKRAKKKLICPRHSNCDTVIHSDYSRVLGIPVEVLGVIYYAFIFVAYVFVAVSGYWSDSLALVLLAVSICAVFFSIYLVTLQAFIVKHWCIWCLSSAFISLAIFIVSYLYILS